MSRTRLLPFFIASVFLGGLPAEASRGVSSVRGWWLSVSEDENRNLVQMEDPDGRVTKLDYDELNRLFRTTRDPGGLNLVTETTDFDEDGHPERILEANGEVTRQTWDELGRLSTRTHEPPAAGWAAPWAYTTEERYHYDPNSNLERVEEHDVRKDGTTVPERVTKRGYDRLDRQTSETVTLQDRTTSSVTTEYYRDGRVKSVTDPRGVTSYTYDGQGREETATTSGGVTRKTYYADGLVKDITFPNGTKRAHGYDKADRLLTIVTTKDEAAVASTVYTYDPNGNRLTQMQTNGGADEATTYTYDDLDRLATVTYAPDATHPNGRKVTYGHDGAGNRETEVVTDPQTEVVLESKTGHFDDANRLTELTDNLDPVQTTTLSWDKNGNLLSETKTGITTTYRYDLRDTLAEVERGGQTLARFLGDFDERRVLKIGDPTRPGGSGFQEYLYHGSRLVVEVENSQSTARYEWTNEELVSLLQSGGARRYFALDGLETVLALTDEQGQATDRLGFDAWGVPKEGTDFGTSGNRFAFTSHRFDTELDLYYAGGRMYSPTIGRFISQDTLSLEPNNPDSWNLFSYARANPTRYVDPTGHAAGDLWDPRTYFGGENERAGAWQGFKEGYFQNAADVGDSLGAFGKGAYGAGKGFVVGTVGLAVKGAELDHKLKMGSLQQKQEAVQEMYSMGKGAVTHLWESGTLLTHGVRNPGDVLDAMTELGIEGSGQAIGGATFETGLLVAPLAKGAPVAAVAKEARHGVNLLAPKAVQPAARAAAAMDVPAGAEALLQTAGRSGRTVGDFLDAARARGAATAADFPEVGVVAQRRAAAVGGKAYEARIADLYGGRAAFSARAYETSVAGKRVSGVADNVTRIDVQSAAVEAKYVDDWATSIRNPRSPMALGESFERARAIAKAERATMVSQAQKLSSAFDRVIYHSNSPELIQYYSRLFQRFKLKNVDFVLTP